MMALLLGTTIWMAGCTQSPPSGPDPIAAGFVNPPNDARPRVWWHWMNGNVTKDGIQKDIEWMSRVGIGGLQNFDASLFTPQVVEKRLVYMTPEWKDAFRHAATLADKHGLELAIAASPGWSETGGPWVSAEDAMKKLVWSEMIVEGGKPFSGRLPAPPRNTGRFQDAPLEGTILGPPDPNTPTHYADSAVVAYRLPDAATPLPVPRMSFKGTAIDAAKLTDSKFPTSIDFARGTVAQPAIINVDYPAAVTIRSMSIAMTVYTDSFGGGGPGVEPFLEAEVNGSWTQVAQLDLKGSFQSTASFKPVTAQRFRVAFKPSHVEVPLSNLTGAPGAEGFSVSGPPPSTFGVRELRLSSEAQVNRFEVKAGFGHAQYYYDLDQAVANEPGVPVASVIDLTAQMKPDGQLDWTPPAGRWKVLRLGYSLSGQTNHPAPKEATGLEVDKMDGDAVRRYLETYLSMYRDAAGADMVGQRGVRAFLNDSIETGTSNWTGDILDHFERLRGYDPTPWLPALTGAVIGSREESDRFLYDFRRTLADLLTSEHYGTVAAVARENNLITYGESLEDRRPVLGDDLSMRKYVDVPMAALWTYNRAQGPRASFIGDMKGAASVANVYGRKIVAAESLTAALSPWAFAPRDLKTFIDFEFVNGINRPVIHTSVHQPLDDRQPGFSLLIFGQYFNRHESWAEMAKPWVDYMARSSFMLQQGRHVADVAYFIGEERPASLLFAEGQAEDRPRTFGYDLINADILVNELSFKGNEIVAPGSARYRAIYLGGDSEQMTLPVLRKLASLAESGAVIIGQAPTRSPSLHDSKAEFDTLVSKLWSGQPETKVGSGRVLASDSAEAGLKAAGLRSDFAYDNANGDREVLFLHRQLSDGEVYYLTNRKDRRETFEARFRVTGKAPEIWRAETGASEPVGYRIENGETVVSLDMRPDDAVFVVFRKPATTDAFTPPADTWREQQTLASAWDVGFQPGRGAPASARIERLASLSEHADAGIKYFSGVAAYRTTFEAPALQAGQKVKLDLGSIGDVAEVYVNGALIGTVWNAPYALDVTQALKPGQNQLEVKVANLWVNRLIGDKQPGAEKLTFTIAPTYKADAPLRPSGLIGPVKLLTTQ
jgi:hypothetical protein